MTDTPPPEQVADAWDALAAGYDEFITPESLRHGEIALGRVEIGPGTRFLDVAAGTGALSIPAARRGAEVVATDLAPAMIERLVARARAEGLTHVEGRVLDTRALVFPDDTFDVSASQNGVTMLPDLDAGLAEMVRVTRPGGTVLVAAFGPLPKVEFLTFLLDAARAAVPDFTGPPMDPPPPPFQLADRDVFRERLTEAGLHDVAVDTITWDMTVESPTHLFNEVATSNPIGARLVAGLSEDQRTEVLRVLDGLLHERSGDRPSAVLHADVNVGIGVK